MHGKTKEILEIKKTGKQDSNDMLEAKETQRNIQINLQEEF